MYQEDIIHSRSLSFSPFLSSSPMSFLLISLVISSIRVAYSMTDSTPPCRILSLIVIFLVGPYLVCICAVSPVFSFLIISRFFFLLRFYIVRIGWRLARLCHSLSVCLEISCMLFYPSSVFGWLLLLGPLGGLQ